MPRVTGLAIVIALLVGCAPDAVAPPDSTADDAFAALSARFLDEFPALSPVFATALGDHRYDDRMDDIGPAGRAANARLLRDFQKALGALDFSLLSRGNQVDARLLEHELAQQLWLQDELQEWAWNPLVYTNLAGNSIYGLLARDFAPLAQRLTNVASRLRALPGVFAQVRETLDPARVPEVHARTALQQNPGLLAIIENMLVPQLDAVDAPLRADLQAAIAVAQDAVQEHQQWLEEQLLPNAAGDFRIGREKFERKLTFVLNSNLSMAEIKTRAEQEFRRIRAQMYAAAQDIYRRDNPDSILPSHENDDQRQAFIESALELAYADVPAADGIVEFAEQTLASTTRFVRERNLISLPDDPVEIIVMPEFQRGVAVAYCDSPGPLDKGLNTFYAVAPLPEDWTPDQVSSFLREYNKLSIEDLTIHEAMPGHFVQLSIANDYPSLLRSVLSSGPFIEGWAVYAERMMIEEGYRDGDPLMRLINLKWYLRAVINALIDQGIHVDGMTRDEAMALMMRGGFQEESEAAGKWTRAQLTSTQLSTYFVGYQEHADLRAASESAWGQDFDLKRYHDTVLSFGSPPGQYVKALVLNEPIPGIAAAP